MNKIEQTRKEHSPRKIEPKQPVANGKVVEDTIEQTRKELEDNYKRLNDLISKRKLQYFNLGVQLTQKEFLQIIDKLYPLCICKGGDVDKNCPNEWVENWSDNINRELKQSLEMKDKKAVNKK